MNYLHAIRNYLTVSAMAPTLALCQSSLTEGEIARRVPVLVDGGASQLVPLEDLLAREHLRNVIPRAYTMYDSLRAMYPDLMTPAKYNLPGGKTFVSRFHLQEVYDFAARDSVRFDFGNGLWINFSRTQGSLKSIQASSPQDQEGEPVLPRERLLELARQLAEVAGVVVDPANSAASFPMDTARSDINFYYLATLPGTRIHLGPGISGLINKHTGLPTHVQFAYDTPPYEPQFRDLITSEEGYGLGTALAYDRVPWSAYQIRTLAPSLSVPNFGDRQVTRSPRHAELIAAGRRCLTTTVLVSPITETDQLTHFITFTFDSQTRELLATNEVTPAMFGSPSGKPLTNQLNEKQMLALPNLSLKIPLVRVEDAMKPETARLVAVRQNKFTFKALLDEKTRVLWIEDRPYQSTRAFTAALLKAFPPRH